MRVLVTGATGFIGSHLVKRLAEDHEVFGLVRRQPPNPIVGVRYVLHDLLRPLNETQLPFRLDALVHQAAVINAEAEKDDAIPFLVNVVATWRLLAYAAKANVATFVHASTGGIYGCGPQPFRESDPPNPMDLYSLTKAQAELAVQAAPGTFHKVILRYFFPYGVGTPNPIPHYVKRAVRSEVVDLIEDGGPKLNPIHISEAVEATARALQLEENIALNIAGSQATTFAEIARIAAQLSGKQLRQNLVPIKEALPYYSSDLLAATHQMQAKLLFSPQVSLETGIAELVASYYNSV